jgi:urease accessory protein
MLMPQKRPSPIRELRRPCGAEVWQGLSLACGLALVQPAHAHGDLSADGDALQTFVNGLSHPATGLDHFAAMFAVGVLSLLLGRRHLLRLPAAFLIGMAAGSVTGRWLATAGVSVSAGFEAGVLLSVMWLGALIAWPRPWAAWAVYGPVAAFGALHGAVHGLEAGPTRSGVYVAGLLCGTALIHLLGVFGGDMVRMGKRWRWKAGALGGAIMACGAVLGLQRWLA